jgi:hypothetical protein
MKITQTLLLAALLALGAACGYSAKATTPATAGTLPNINALVPDNANAGSTSLVLTVNGTSFGSDATIDWNGTALTTSYVSANQLTATVPDSDVATSGTATVTVTNPATAGGIYGGGTLAETSNDMTFTIN